MLCWNLSNLIGWKWSHDLKRPSVTIRWKYTYRTRSSSRLCQGVNSYATEVVIASWAASCGLSTDYHCPWVPHVAIAHPKPLPCLKSVTWLILVFWLSELSFVICGFGLRNGLFWAKSTSKCESGKSKTWKTRWRKSWKLTGTTFLSMPPTLKPYLESNLIR